MLHKPLDCSNSLSMCLLEIWPHLSIEIAERTSELVIMHIVKLRKREIYDSFAVC